MEFLHDAAPSADANGSVLGHYRLLEKLGVGGMGEVYKAEHLLLKRVVVLKILGTVATDQQNVARNSTVPALREIEAAGRFSHPNIVAVLDAGQEAGMHFLVMEYVEGTDLEHLVAEKGPLPIDVACECIRQAALGLQYLHERGYIHRDVKPANLLLEGNLTGPLAQVRVRLLDMGLARSWDNPEILQQSETAVAYGSIPGTVHYLAPELIESEQAGSIRSDIYSLGCTFYYLLTAKLPFPGSTWTEVLLKHRLDPPIPLAKVRPEVPGRVARLVRQMLAKDPADRPEEPRRIVHELRKFLDASPGGMMRDERHAAKQRHQPNGTGGTVAGRTLGTRGCVLGLIALTLLGAVLIGLRLHARNFPGLDAEPASDLAESSAGNFVLLSSGHSYFGLSEAVAAANDGDTILVRGPGPHRIPPVDIKGKALTLQAADGPRPRLELYGPPRNPFWKGMFTTDRPLRIEGLELFRSKGKSANAEAGCLIWTTAALALERCRLEAPGQMGVICCESPGEVVIGNCELTAVSQLVSVSLPGRTDCRVRIEDSQCRLTGSDGVALSFRIAEGPDSAALRVELNGDDIEGQRVVALSCPLRSFDLRMTRNHFRCTEALLSYRGTAAPEEWRRSVSWTDEKNECQEATPIVRR